MLSILQKKLEPKETYMVLQKPMAAFEWPFGSAYEKRNVTMFLYDVWFQQHGATWLTPNVTRIIAPNIW